MALSVLPLGPSRLRFGLWNSVTNSFQEKGTEKEMEDRKHNIEQLEQALANEAWKKEVRNKRIAELVADGYEPAIAKHIVKTHIPGLWQTDLDK